MNIDRASEIAVWLLTSNSIAPNKVGATAPIFMVISPAAIPARIAELIDWFGKADLVLEATLADTLTREELGFPAATAQGADDGDD